ncbi:MAG: glycosyltransferase [Candidatus Tectomicrobia bacterium]|uniref:Glycosyltransferase n=1 Tax=Tectimicrobiota bacterium TaxID=2528274 RepID=A0A932CME3_UNCTE|nr:glycosyltransferase [Candidatus Tectomicrobia bacterium]
MKQPLRVAYVLKRYPRLSQTFVVNEMLELQRQGVEVTIVALKDSGEEVVHEKSRALQASIYYFPPASAIPLEGWALRHHEGLSGEPRWLGLDALGGEETREEQVTWIQAALVAPLLKKLGIDHLHAHFATRAATAASFMSRITGIPYSFTAHARDIYHESVNQKALAEKIERASFVITVSDFNRNYLEALIRSEGRSGQIIRLYIGMDLVQLRPVGGEWEPDLLVSVGRLVQKKGLDYLIEACRILKEKGRRFRCLIIGEGEERAALEGQVAQASLQEEVSLMGARPHPEVIRTIQRAAAFVLPCVVGEDGDRDGLPTVLLEAMALGTPVISTRIAGIPEMIAHGQTGLLVEERDPVALAQAVEELLASATLPGRLGESALEKVRREFDLAENVRRLKGYFLSGGEGA